MLASGRRDDQWFLSSRPRIAGRRASERQTGDRVLQPIDSRPPAGEMAALTWAFDWAATPLGPPSSWPVALRTAVGIVLNSNHPMFIWWGPDLIQFYNDAYRKTMGPERHPCALGQPGRECWEEIWPIIGPQIESIMAGGPATWHEDQLVPVTRHGQREDVWWTYGYSPIPDDNGHIGGVLVVCTDVTNEHVAKDELLALNDRLAKEVQLRRYENVRQKLMFEQAPGFMCILRGPEHVFDFANDAYLRLIGTRFPKRPARGSSSCWTRFTQPAIHSSPTTCRSICSATGTPRCHCAIWISS